MAVEKRRSAQGAPREPRAKKMPPHDMIRDEGIKELAAIALDDGATVAAMIYETAGGQILAWGVPNSPSVILGMLVQAIKALEPGVTITF